MARIHRSHIGVNGCLRARESIYWPVMTSAIKDYVSQCETCRSYETTQQKEKLCPHEFPERAWSKVAENMHDDGQYLVTVNYFSNFWKVDRMDSNTKSRAVIQKLNSALLGMVSRILWCPTTAHSLIQNNSECLLRSGSPTMSPPAQDTQSPMEWSKALSIKPRVLLKKAKRAETDPWLAILDHRNTHERHGHKSCVTTHEQKDQNTVLLPTSGKLLKPKVIEGVKKEKEKVKAKHAHYYNKSAKDLPHSQQGRYRAHTAPERPVRDHG